MIWSLFLALTYDRFKRFFFKLLELFSYPCMSYGLISCRYIGKCLRFNGCGCYLISVLSFLLLTIIFSSIIYMLSWNFLLTSVAISAYCLNWSFDSWYLSNLSSLSLPFHSYGSNINSPFYLVDPAHTCLRTLSVSISFSMS